MSAIRLHRSAKLDQMLADLRKKQFPLMDDAEIIRICVSHAYVDFYEEASLKELEKRRQWADSLPTETLTERQQKRLERARADLAAGKGKALMPDEDIGAFFKR